MGPQRTLIKPLTTLMALTALMGPGATATAAQCPAVPRVAVVGGTFAAAQVAAIAWRHDDWWTTPTRSFYVTTGGSPSAGQDLLLHGAIAYQASQLSTLAWRWACAGGAAPWLGAATGILVALPKEIGDGFHEQKGFSLDDMAGTVVGAVLPALHASVPASRMVALKANWWPSDELRNRPPGGLPQIENDYAGQRYFLSLVPGRAWPDLPVPWLGLALGHSTTTWASVPPQSEWYVTLDVELRRLPIHARWWRTVATVLDQVKVPLPGLRVTGGNVRPGLY